MPADAITLMRQQRWRCTARWELRAVWTCYVLLPLAYLLLLPALSRLDPFSKGSFAIPGKIDGVTSPSWYPPHDSASISRYVQTGASGGAFAASTAPAIHYVWVNPFSRARRSIAMTVGAALLTGGWAGLILLPVSFGSHEAHAVAWAVFLTGYGVHAVACVCVIEQRSSCLMCYVAATLPFVILSSFLYFIHSLAWLIVQYLVAASVLVFMPLVNTVAQWHQPGAVATQQRSSRTIECAAETSL